MPIAIAWFFHIAVENKEIRDASNQYYGEKELD
jgi:hypothetical protein